MAAEGPPPAAPDAAAPAVPAADPPTAPAPAPTPPIAAVATNVSTVIQAILQVQQGCQTFCTATTLTQTASQLSSTAQTAVATVVAGPGSAPGTAAAANATRTIQVIAQLQFGCVAFCFGTVQTQAAAQAIQVTQAALAAAPDAATAQNVATSAQFVLQLQQGCTTACSGATASGSASQIAGADQLAQATDPAISVLDPGAPAGPGVSASSAQAGVPAAEAEAFLAWVAALASELAATVQTSVQVQVAACLAHCTGGVQSQSAAQVADVLQVSVARAGTAPAPVVAPATTAASAPAADATPSAAGAPAAAVEGAPHRRHGRRRAAHAAPPRLCVRLTLRVPVPKPSGVPTPVTGRSLHSAQTLRCDRPLAHPVTDRRPRPGLVGCGPQGRAGTADLSSCASRPARLAGVSPAPVVVRPSRGARGSLPRR
jgi:hypothetical protein